MTDFRLHICSGKYDWLFCQYISICSDNCYSCLYISPGKYDLISYLYISIGKYVIGFLVFTSAYVNTIGSFAILQPRSI